MGRRRISHAWNLENCRFVCAQSCGLSLTLIVEMDKNYARFHRPHQTRWRGARFHDHEATTHRPGPEFSVQSL